MIINDQDLRTLNTLQLPARAEAFARFSSVSELLSLLDHAAANGLPLRVLGGGSNILLANNVPGLVLQSAMTGVQVLSRTAEYCRVAVDADRKSTRLNSSHAKNSYAVSCLKQQK